VVGQTLSHYKILEKLGSGGMGDVYVAEDTKLHRKVALKILSPEMASEERRHRFEREAQAVAALNHPNIVTVFSVEESDGVHFITMELVKGKTLTELISKKGLPLNTFFDVAIPLADAVRAAHEKDIIHRDLKPDNLMVNDEGRLKILDFGLAKLKQEFAQEGASELPTKSATQEGQILGTVAYMSPEQAEGKSVDHRSDIFSMGIILYEMATGERPFKGETRISILSSIVKDTPTSVTKINPERPHILARITISWDGVMEGETTSGSYRWMTAGSTPLQI
jgi:serine/threonine protein kinase